MTGPGRHDVTDTSGWITLARFGARWEADLLVEALRAAKIPVLVEGADTAIFGPGFSGSFALGIEVRVPIEFEDYAEDIRSVFDTSPPAEPREPVDDPENPDYPEEAT
jgi:hypothetical protein